LHQEDQWFSFAVYPSLMKKIVASGCCIFLLQSVSHIASGTDTFEQQASQKRTFLRAIASIVNTEANRKGPQRRTCLPNLECPHL
jgi:hypothetical protein